MKMMRKMMMTGCVALLCFFMTNCGEESAATSETETATHEHAGQHYQCPMDCEKGKTYEEEGKCPECKMDLKAVE